MHRYSPLSQELCSRLAVGRFVALLPFLLVLLLSCPAAAAPVTYEET